MLPKTPDSASLVDGGCIVAVIREYKVAILAFEAGGNRKINQLERSRQEIPHIRRR